MDFELHDLIELVNTVAPQHSDAKSELITLLVVWDKQLGLLHEFLERVSEFALESMDDAQEVLGNIDQLKLGTRWGWDGDSI